MKRTVKEYSGNVYSELETVANRLDFLVDQLKEKMNVLEVNKPEEQKSGE